MIRDKDIVCGYDCPLIYSCAGRPDSAGDDGGGPRINILMSYLSIVHNNNMDIIKEYIYRAIVPDGRPNSDKDINHTVATSRFIGN